MKSTSLLAGLLIFRASIGVTPEDYDTHLAVDISVLEDEQVPAA